MKLSRRERTRILRRDNGICCWCDQPGAGDTTNEPEPRAVHRWPCDDERRRGRIR